MLIATCPREISFIIAAKSYRRPIIGHIARAIGAIPVERAQDIAEKGKGGILSIDLQGQVKGENCKFSTFFQVGDQIHIESVHVLFRLKRSL